MQVFISRVTIPRSFDDLREQVRREALDSGTLIGASDLQVLADWNTVNWSLPKHAMDGDVVLFQISQNAGERARRLSPQIDAMSADDADWMGMSGAVEYAEAYAGALFAVGRVDGSVTTGQGLSPHVRSRSFGTVTDLYSLPSGFRVVGHPIWSKWPEFAPQGPVQYRQFSSNDRYTQLVDALSEAVVRPLPEWVAAAPVTTGSGDVSRSTWMQLAQDAASGYATEAGVRHMYADWLLRELSDRRVLYDEVDTVRAGDVTGRVDNVIIVDRTPVPVEVKIRATAEPDLFEQLDRYRDSDTLRKGDKTFPERNHDIVLVIDQDGIYITDGSMTTLPPPTIRRKDTTSNRIDDFGHELRRRIREIQP